jgi:hypothetical protein
MRRPAAASSPRPGAAPAAAQRPTRAAPSRGLSFAPAEEEEAIKLNLGDIPRAQETLDVEGFKPTLLSRLFDLIAPNK